MRGIFCNSTISRCFRCSYQNRKHSRDFFIHDSGKTDFPNNASCLASIDTRQMHPISDNKQDVPEPVPYRWPTDDRQHHCTYDTKPTAQRVARYIPDCLYGSQSVYAYDKYKISRQRLALPKLFNSAQIAAETKWSRKITIRYNAGHDEAVILYRDGPLPSCIITCRMTLNFEDWMS